MLKSINHICFLDDKEFILVDNKTIYSCPISNVIDGDTHNRSGSYVCDLVWALRQRGNPFYFFLCEEIMKVKTEQWKIANDHS
jgi:hypothetical protein